MNRLFICAAIAALAVYAQDAKVAPGTNTPTSAPPPERPLTETEVLKLQLASTKIQLLQKEFRIEQYQKEVAPLSAEQNAVATAACRSIGIPEDLVQTQCGIVTGIGPDGKPQLDAAGKPVMPRVWWVKTMQPPAKATP
jgi:hypothetical protein